MIPSATRSIKYILYTSTIILVLLLAVLFLLKFYLPAKIQQIVNDTMFLDGYVLNVQNVSYDFISGFVFKKIDLKSKSTHEIDRLEIDNAAANINFLYSIVKRKLVLDSIDIGDFDVSVSEKLVESIYSFSKDDTRSDRDQKRLIELLSIDELQIDKFSFSYNGKYNLNLVNFYSSIGDLDALNNINFRTDANVFDQKLYASGKLIFSDTLIESYLDLKTDIIKIPGLNESVIPSLLLKSHLKADLENQLALNASIDIKRPDYPDSKALIGKIHFSSLYTDKPSNMHVNKLDIEIIKLFKITSSGEIEDLQDRAEVNMSGVVENINIGKLNKMLMEYYQTEFDVNLLENAFKIKGNITDNTLNVSGNIKFNEASIYNKDIPVQIKKSRGDLTYRYYIFNGELDSNINLVSEIGQMVVENTDGFILGSELNYSFKDEIKKGLLNFTARSNNFADGYTELRTDIDFANKENPVAGVINASNLNLSKLNYSSVKTKGELENLLINFHGNLSRLDVYSDFDMRNISIEGYSANVSSVRTTTPVSLSVDISDEKLSVEKVVLNFKKLDLSEINYEDISVSKIFLDVSCPDLLNAHIPVQIIMTGNQFSYYNNLLEGDEIALSFDGNIGSETSFTGKTIINSLRYKSYSIENITSSLTYKEDKLDFKDAKANIKGIGNLNIPILRVGTKNTMSFPSLVNIEKGYFLADNNEDEITDISFSIEKVNNDKWNGFLSISRIESGQLIISNFRSFLEVNNNKINFGTFKGVINEGNLEGNLSYIDNINNSVLNTDINFYDLKIKSNQNTIVLGNLNFHYTGEFKEDKSIPEGKGKIEFKNLYIQGYEDDARLYGSVDLSSNDETMLLQNGLINGEKSSLFTFRGGLKNPLNDNRTLTFEIENMHLVELKKFLNPYLPVFIRYGEVDGDMYINLEAKTIPDDTTLIGYMDFRNINIKGDPFSTYFNMENLNGRLDFDESIEELENIQETIRRHTKGYRDAYRHVLVKSDTELAKPTLSLDKLEYGFFKLENIKLLLKLLKNKLVFKILHSGMFKGNLYASGIYNLSDRIDSPSKLYLLFENMSLNNISESIPGTEGYISGRFNGIMSLVQKVRKTNNLDGLMDFWTLKSKDEERKIGKAFIQRLGAKERFFLGSDKSYDKGVLRGYIKDGIITFSELEISNSTFGINDLNIKVHNERNSISVNHLLSVIRETSRRVEKGTIDFKFQN